jgi:hypothetical protein
MSKLCDIGSAGFPKTRRTRRRIRGFPLGALCSVARCRAELPLSVHYNPHYASNTQDTIEQSRGFPRRHTSILSLFCRKGFDSISHIIRALDHTGLKSHLPRPLKAGYSVSEPAAFTAAGTSTGFPGVLPVSTEAGSSPACRCRSPHPP